MVTLNWDSRSPAKTKSEYVLPFHDRKQITICFKGPEKMTEKGKNFHQNFEKKVPN